MKDSRRCCGRSPSSSEAMSRHRHDGDEDDALRDLRDRAHAAATLAARRVRSGLQGYLIVYGGLACLLTFWLLPGLVAAKPPTSAAGEMILRPRRRRS